MSDFRLIEASAGPRPKVAGTAYTGGGMRLPGWRHPVVVDLSGMEIPDTVPLLTNHENRTDARVGMVRAKVAGGSLEIEGDIVSDGEAANGIVAQCRAGADWQLSIGADVRESELVKADREVNGQIAAAPFYLVSKSVLREVSVVAVGADQSTRMRVSASFDITHPDNVKGEEMEEKKNTLDATAQPTPLGQADIDAAAKAAAEGAVTAERGRVSAIAEICKGEFPEIEREAVKCGWTPEETTAKVLAAVRAARPAANQSHWSLASPEAGIING